MPAHPLRHGLDLFNSREFFECHEVWEEIWTPERGPRRWFLQALIHMAVGFYHHQQGNAEGMNRQLDKGLKKLAGYLPVYDGIDTRRLYLEVLAWRDSTAAPPPRIIELQSS